MTSCLYFLKSGLFVKYDVLTTANTDFQKRTENKLTFTYEKK